MTTYPAAAISITGQPVDPIAVYSIGKDGQPLIGKKTYPLAYNIAATPTVPTGPIDGGNYILRVEADNFNGATVSLDILNLDGTNYTAITKTDGTALSFTVNGQSPIIIGEGSLLKLKITGSPTNVRANLSGY